ncbi:MAG TPA: FHA domain-containing protein [Pirellulales bacterium]|nr:FHA domain-containing protein [Pirellulales bacterium]
MTKERVRTMIESLESVREALAETNHASLGGAPRPQRSEPSSFQRYRPQLRPPILLLGVLDDGADTYETVRVRTDRFVVGRVEGDLVIPHDINMSGTHFEIMRSVKNGEYYWTVRDLNSTNGTFASVSNSPLTNGQELFLGSYTRRFRFDTGHAPAKGTEPPPGERLTTSAWHAITDSGAATTSPAIVEVTPTGDGQRYVLSQQDQTVGCRGAASIVIDGDPCVEPRHCRIFADKKGRWRIENLSTMNGTWLRVDEVQIDRTAKIQAGEQRFVFKRS